LHDHILDTSLATADIAAALVDTYLTEAEAAARELASRPGVQTAAERGELASLSPELVHWLTEHPQMGSVGILDLEGRRLATGQDVAVGLNGAAERDWFQAVLATRAPYLGAPGLSAINGRPRLPYGVPVTDPSGALRGVLITSISLESLSETLMAVR